MATEDSWEHTIVPRLMAADADLERVYLIVAEKSTDNTATAMITLPDDLADVERLIVEKQIVALMLDPLMSRLGRLDSHKDQEVRQALEPLVAMAHRTHCVILGLIHVNKAQRTDPLTSLMASRAFSAVARAVMFVMVDPEDEDTRLLGHPKHNIGPHMPTLKFSIADHRIGKGIQTGRLEWTGESDRSISDALQQHLEQARGNESITATKEVADWLHEYLTKPGGQAPSSEIKKDGEERDYADGTLKRAKNKLGLPLVSNWGCGCGSIRVERRWTCWWSIRRLGRTLISCYGYADDC